jgi:hypothetical protein
MGMDSDELAHEAVCMNRAIARCLHHLAATLLEEKLGDFMLLLNDVQSKNMKMAGALQHSLGDRPDNKDPQKNIV